MSNILGPICIAMLVASFDDGAGTGLFDNAADSNTATTEETSNNTRVRRITQMVQATQTHRKIP